jgi:hypothetical protein
MFSRFRHLAVCTAQHIINYIVKNFHFALEASISMRIDVVGAL